MSLPFLSVACNHMPCCNCQADSYPPVLHTSLKSSLPFYLLLFFDMIIIAFFSIKQNKRFNLEHHLEPKERKQPLLHVLIFSILNKTGFLSVWWWRCSVDCLIMLWSHNWTPFSITTSVLSRFI